MTLNDPLRLSELMKLELERRRRVHNADKTAPAPSKRILSLDLGGSENAVSDWTQGNVQFIRSVSAERIAKYFGIEISELSSLLNKLEPDADLLRRVAERLSVSVDELKRRLRINGYADPPPPSKTTPTKAATNTPTEPVEPTVFVHAGDTIAVPSVETMLRCARATLNGVDTATKAKVYDLILDGKLVFATIETVTSD